MNWTERFDDGAWQPLRDREVIVFLQAGVQYIAIEATERNMAGMAAVARLSHRGLSSSATSVTTGTTGRTRGDGPAACHRRHACGLHD
jgi:hypothetical protein